MNDDMSYYNFEELNTYKTKCVKNILLYVIYVMLFVLTNIIIYFINNDVLYGVLVSIVWILFLNFSIIYFEMIVLPFSTMILSSQKSLTASGRIFHSASSITLF